MIAQTMVEYGALHSLSAAFMQAFQPRRAFPHFNRPEILSSSARRGPGADPHPPPGRMIRFGFERKS